MAEQAHPKTSATLMELIDRQASKKIRDLNREHSYHPRLIYE
jgi:hypothetical protein